MIDDPKRMLALVLAAALALTVGGCAEPGEPRVGVELTAGAAWEYRGVVGAQLPDALRQADPQSGQAPDEARPAVRPGSAPPKWTGPWRATLDEALHDLAATHQPAQWPRKWSAFGPLPGRSWISIDGLKAVPEVIEHKLGPLKARPVTADARGEVNLEPLFTEASDDGRTAYLLTEVDSSDDRVLTVHLASDCGVHVWLDGDRVYRGDAGEVGSRLHGRARQFALPLTKGRHILAIRLSGGPSRPLSLVLEATRLSSENTATMPIAVEARRVFTAADPSAYASLTVHDVGNPLPAVNGEPVEPPLPRMRHRVIRGVPASSLREGQNQLTVRWGAEELAVGVPATQLRHFPESPAAKRLAPHGELYALATADVAVDLGPILGATGDDFCTVTCRTNMPAHVELHYTVAGQDEPLVVRSADTGRYHRFRVTGYSIRDVRSYWFTLGFGGGSQATEAWRLPPRKPRPLRFAAVGDSQSGRHWSSVAAAIERARPDFFIILGDLVGQGLDETHWRERFWRPARSLLATTPTYAVLGNHDNNSPIFAEIIYTPDGKEGRTSNWSQEIGGVLMVGIDGKSGFRPGNDNHAWLRRILAESDARFIFLCQHYPPWSSAGHGSNQANGKAREWTAEQGRRILMPMLREYGATAMLTGHEHFYERNEPPGGVTHVISAGGGLGLRRKSRTAAQQNPYSTAFARENHFCLFTLSVLSPETRTMQAIAENGRVFDTRVWTARTPPKRGPERVIPKPAAAPAAAAAP